MIPPLQPDGNLPPGVHYVTDWPAFVKSYATNPHRAMLANGLTEALRNLQAAGCKTAYIDGSFITNKATPSDFDGCWEPSHVDPAKLDPVLRRFDNFRAAQKAKYGGELFPASGKANHAGDTYLTFFQTDKATGRAKGIVAVDLTTTTL